MDPTSTTKNYSQKLPQKNVGIKRRNRENEYGDRTEKERNSELRGFVQFSMLDAAIIENYFRV